MVVFPPSDCTAAMLDARASNSERSRKRLITKQKMDVMFMSQSNIKSHFSVFRKVLLSRMVNPGDCCRRMKHKKRIKFITVSALGNVFLGSGYLSSNYHESERQPPGWWRGVRAELRAAISREEVQVGAPGNQDFRC